MKLISATVYALRLPFVASFAHSAKERAFSDSIVVKVRDESASRDSARVRRANMSPAKLRRPRLRISPRHYGRRSRAVHWHLVRRRT